MTTGRKSGQSRTTPVTYLQDGENAVIVASNGGAAKHPSWFLNLRAHPEAEVQIGRDRKRVRAEVASDEERARLWPLVVQMYSGYDESEGDDADDPGRDPAPSGVASMVEPPELRTERLLLRSLRLDDVDDVFAYAADDPEWAFYNKPVPQPYTRQHAEEFVARCVGADASRDLEFALVLDSRVVGSVRLTIDKEHGTAGLGYSIAREHWGKGLTPEAVRAILDWAFPTFGLTKVISSADARNERSWRVMEKVGMKREVIVRGQRIARDGPADEVVYGLSREEWERAVR